MMFNPFDSPCSFSNLSIISICLSSPANSSFGKGFRFGKGHKREGLNNLPHINLFPKRQGSPFGLLITKMKNVGSPHHNSLAPHERFTALKSHVSYVKLQIKRDSRLLMARKWLRLWLRCDLNLGRGSGQLKLHRSPYLIYVCMHVHIHSFTFAITVFATLPAAAEYILIKRVYSPILTLDN